MVRRTLKKCWIAVNSSGGGDRRGSQQLAGGIVPPCKICAFPVFSAQKRLHVTGRSWDLKTNRRHPENRHSCVLAAFLALRRFFRHDILHDRSGNANLADNTSRGCGAADFVRAHRLENSTAVVEHRAIHALPLFVSYLVELAGHAAAIIRCENWQAVYYPPHQPGLLSLAAGDWRVGGYR